MYYANRPQFRPRTVGRATLGDDVGFWQMLIAPLLSTGLQLKAQSNAQKLEKAKIAAAQNLQLQQIQAAQRQESSGFSGLSPMMLAALVGIPLVAFLVLRK